MIPELLTEATQHFERDHHQPHGRIQERRDRPLSPHLQPVREQRPPRALPGPLQPRDYVLIYEFVQVTSEGVVGEPCLGEYLMKGFGLSIPQNGQDAFIVDVHFTN